MSTKIEDLEISGVRSENKHPKIGLEYRYMQESSSQRESERAFFRVSACTHILLQGITRVQHRRQTQPSRSCMLWIQNSEPNSLLVQAPTGSCFLHVSGLRFHIHCPKTLDEHVPRCFRDRIQNGCLHEESRTCATACTLDEHIPA